MRYRLLGRTGLSVSEIGLGALEIGRNWPYWQQEMEEFNRPGEQGAIRIVHEAIDHGVNLIDTAAAYMESEELLGKALKGKRSKVVLATKCGEWFDGNQSVYDYSAAATEEFIHSSLRKLKTDWIDLLQIHSGSAEVVKKGETAAAMKKAQKAGKVRFLGISVDRADAAEAAMESGDFDSVQLSYNLMNREMEQSVLGLAQARNIGIIVKDGLATGKLTPKYKLMKDFELQKKVEEHDRKAKNIGIRLQEYAIRFVLANQAVSSIIVGTKKLDHLFENLKYSDGEYGVVRKNAMEVAG